MEGMILAWMLAISIARRCLIAKVIDSPSVLVKAGSSLEVAEEGLNLPRRPDAPAVALRGPKTKCAEMLEQMPKSIAAIPVSRMLLFFGETIFGALSVGRPPCAARRTLRREALSSQLISALFGFPISFFKLPGHPIHSNSPSPQQQQCNHHIIPQLCSGSDVLFITFGCYP